MAPGPGLTLSIAEKRFPGIGTPLLADFALTIAPGSVVALHGPSGIGKSTLLRLVAGIDRAYAGSIAIDGTPAHLAPAPGFVFQDARLLPWLTALDNVRAADPAMSHATAQAALAQLGLADAANAYPRQLSGGMQRRVALARALAPRPRLLLLDEPFVSLDQSLVEELYAVLKTHLAETKATLLLASHSPNDAAHLADRVLTLANHPATIIEDLAFHIPRESRDQATLKTYAELLA